MSAFPLSRGGREDPLLPRLRSEMHRASDIDLAVSFVMVSGLDLLFDELAQAVEERDARLRMVTTDYLNVTEPEALRRLMLLVERGADIRVYESRERSFHLKAYLFVRSEGGRIVDGNAWIGSSNLSRTALLDGIEWNYRVDALGGEPPSVRERFHHVRESFESLFHAPEAVPLSYAWIEQYERRRPAVVPAFVPDAGRPGTPPPRPHDLQREALEALRMTRLEGNRRGLVVMATGLGKTWLAAFDVAQSEARRALFVAHREEILLQAEETFQRILPERRVGRYDGTQKDGDGDLVFASIQTLGRGEHLDRFPPDHFDYIVVDEFHHAAAPTYRRLLRHFSPGFLLGLTATPSRTDRSDILSLCDDNLVYFSDLFEAIRLGFLSPFGYWGIWDREVDYEAIPWRNGRFEPEALENRLMVLNRARHVLSEWEQKRGERTLAFCASRRHADFMAEEFRKAGVRAVSVHGASEADRGSSLDALEAGELDVVFSVDLFNEGVDLPALDTVLMLRPTGSTILFLQQLGRGLRRHEGKDRLTVLDFVGNHRSFLHKPQALLGIEPTTAALARIGRRADENGRIELPDGCFVNFDLTLLNLWEEAERREAGVRGDYQALRDSLGRRPSAAEFYRSGADLVRLRHDPGHWWALVREQDDLLEEEAQCLERHEAFLREVETTSMTRSFKMILLQALLDHNGFLEPPRLEDVSAWSLEHLRRRRRLTADLAKSVRDVDAVEPARWHTYWSGNPINAWTGGNRRPDAEVWFTASGGRFEPTFQVERDEAETFHGMVQELVDLRLARYGERVGGEFAEAVGAAGTAEAGDGPPRVRLPVFTSLQAAAASREGGQEARETREVDPSQAPFDAVPGTLEPERYCLVAGEDDALLLVEWLEEADIKEWVGAQLVLARASVEGSDEYLTRTVEEDNTGRAILWPVIPEYEKGVDPRTVRVIGRVVGEVR